jgi:ribose 5-phosphate isomerase A
MNEDTFKRLAAERSLEYVQSGMVLGLGTGSTASFMLHGLAERLKNGLLADIVGVPTSSVTARLAQQLGIAICEPADRPLLDLALDGADEIDAGLRLIKGMGGALLREKIVAASAQRFYVIGSASKLVDTLGVRTPLPVEVVGFALPLAHRRLRDLGATPVLRQGSDGRPFDTDEGHCILDCQFPAITEPEVLGHAIKSIPGVVEHGLFLGMAQLAIVAGPDGVREIARATP